MVEQVGIRKLIDAAKLTDSTNAAREKSCAALRRVVAVQMTAIVQAEKVRAEELKVQAEEEARKEAERKRAEAEAAEVAEAKAAERERIKAEEKAKAAEALAAARGIALRGGDGPAGVVAGGRSSMGGLGVPSPSRVSKIMSRQGSLRGMSRQSSMRGGMVTVGMTSGGGGMGGGMGGGLGGSGGGARPNGASCGDCDEEDEATPVVLGGIPPGYTIHTWDPHTSKPRVSGGEGAQTLEDWKASLKKAMRQKGRAWRPPGVHGTC